MQHLPDRIKEINAYFSPKIVGEVNDVFVKLAKIKGDKIPWHNHKAEDELFYILEGTAVVTRTLQNSNGKMETQDGATGRQHYSGRPDSTRVDANATNTTTTTYKVSSGTFLYFAPHEIHGFVVPEDSPDGNLLMVMVGVAPD